MEISEAFLKSRLKVEIFSCQFCLTDIINPGPMANPKSQDKLFPEIHFLKVHKKLPRHFDDHNF